MPAPDPKLRLALPLRALREAAGLTQAEMAEALGLEQASISRLERRPHAGTDVLAAYARVCGYSCSLVFQRERGRGGAQGKIVAEIAPRARSER